MKTYYIKQKLIDLNEKYSVYDKEEKLYLEVASNGATAFLDNICGSIFSVGHKVYLKKIDGSEFATIKKRTGFLISKYDIFCNEIKIATIKEKITAFSPKISITTDKEEYWITGDIMARDFRISNKGITYATIKKTAFNIKDKYTLTIFDDGNEEIFIATVIAIDNSFHS